MAGVLLSVLLATVVGQSAEQPDCVILQFTATWCQPCQQMRPTLEQLTQEGWDTRPVDADRETQLVQQFRVENLPTLVILSGGREVDRVVGSASYEQIQKRVSRAAARNGNGHHSPNSTSTPQSATSASPQSIVRGQSPGIRAIPNLAVGAVSATQRISQNAPEVTNATHRTEQPLNMEQAVERASKATVRIRVDEANTTAFGTGTIVDVHGDEALVLTCGHLFRDMQSGSQITVDLFAGTPQETNVVSQLIDFTADQADIGLIAFRLPTPVAPVELLPRGEQLQIDQAAFSFGCDHGANPTRRDTRLKSINRYLGAANVEIHGAPAVGRSGGGLFDLQGRLIGVCNAAEPAGDAGIYAAADVFYAQIERLNLGHLFEKSPQTNSQLASNSTATSPNTLAQNTISPASPVHPASFAQPVEPSAVESKLQWPDETAEFAASQPPPPAKPLYSTTQNATRSAADAAEQLICIVRGADGQDKVVTVTSPSSELLQQILQASQR